MTIIDLVYVSEILKSDKKFNIYLNFITMNYLCYVLLIGLHTKSNVDSIQLFNKSFNKMSQLTFN